jgi:ATP-dependent RNA helicase RhlE
MQCSLQLEAFIAIKCIAAVQSARFIGVPRLFPFNLCIGVRLNPSSAFKRGLCRGAALLRCGMALLPERLFVTDTPISGFAAFKLDRHINSALVQAKFTTPTPIQTESIPPLMQGRDIIGIAQTGTGKTAAFALPMLHKHTTEPRRPEARTARMIVLSPTRELAVQIAETFKTLAVNMRVSLATMFGGVSERGQIVAAERGIDILVATPGRLVDLVERRFLRLDKTEVFVLDEADRMLDMGFIRDVKKLVRLLPKNRQSLMFSATMPPAIREMAEEMLRDPVSVSVTPQVVTVEKIDQSVYHVAARQKRSLLLDLLKNEDMKRVVVFCRTKHGANKVADFLEDYGVPVAAIHGNKSQNARQSALNAFKSGNARVLVATDIASRGIDVPGITHVVNYELPNEPESYVHRIGRTARAGKDGQAVAFCDPAERTFLRQIERLTKVQLTVKTHEFAAGSDAEPVRSNRPAPSRDPNRQDEKRFSGKPRGAKPAFGSRSDARKPEAKRPEGGWADTKPFQPKPRPEAERNAPHNRDHGPTPARDQREAEASNAKPKRNRPGSRARAKMRSAA